MKNRKLSLSLSFSKKRSLMEARKLGRDVNGNIHSPKNWKWTCSDPTMVHFFFKVLVPGSYQRLAMPKMFVRDFGKKLSAVVDLRGPRGDTWRIELKKTGNDIYLDIGWGEFVRDHSLQDFEILLFRYDENNPVLDVMVFDRSSCEREYGETIEYAPKFHSFHRVLTQDFHRRLVIPRKIVIELGKDLPEIVFLRGPNGHAWELGVSKTEDGVILESGWPDFLTDHSLEESDFLVFCYDEDETCFHVLMFNKTACEKERFAFSHRSARPEQNAHSNYLEDNMAKMNVKTDAEPGTSKSNTRKKGSYHLYYTSQRRPVTNEEIQRALKSAKAIKSTEPNFISVMQACNVLKRFYVTLPVKFIRENLPQRPRIAFLRIPPSAKAWTVTIIYFNNRIKAGLSGGWAEFVMDNNLEQGDACLFKLRRVGKADPNMSTSVNIDVSIFRVVDEIAPLSMVRV